MSDTKPLSGPPLATLHVIGYLRWERQWYDTFDARRVRLLEKVAQLVDRMGGGVDQGHALRYFLLGGQTVLLEDIAEIRPDLVALMVIYNAGGRLGIGPWYTLVDESLVSGESLIRNLHAGRTDAVRHGIKLIPVAYSPDPGVHPAQLPQILRGFGIGTAFLNYEEPSSGAPMYWEAPDGSSILLVSHATSPPWTNGHPRGALDSVQEQQTTRPDGPYLWLMNYDDMDGRPAQMLANLEHAIGVPTTQSDLPEYLRTVRRIMSGFPAPLTGPVVSREFNRIAQGTLSTRIYLKQASARMQARMTYAVEPWLTVALTHGETAHPENLRAVVAFCWRELLKNQSQMALRGTSCDAAHAEDELRYRKIEDNSQQVITGALTALDGTPTPASNMPHVATDVSKAATYVVVWNPHNWPVRQPVKLDLRLARGYYPARLRPPGSEDDQPFLWTPSEDDESPVSGTVEFMADVPAVGYSAYTVELSDFPTDKRFLIRRAPGAAIGNVAGETLTATGGSLVWKRDQGTVLDMLRFIDGGDAGDAYNYAAPTADREVEAQMVDVAQVESSPLYERLIIDHRMRAAARLNPRRSRDRGVKLLELTTTATFYDHVPGVFFNTTFTNTLRDHRLRAHLRTGLHGASVMAGDVFGLTKYPVGGIVPMQSVASVSTGSRALALMTRGLPELEAIPEDNQLTLALTLVRAVGWLSRDDLPNRPYHVAPPIAVPDAQVQRTLSTEFGMVPVAPGDQAALVRAAQSYSAPVQAYQYDRRPSRTRRSFLSIVSDLGDGSDSDGNGAILTAFKPPQKGRGWIVRLFNPLDRQVEVFITPHTRPEHVQLLNMAEESIRYLDPDANGRALISIKPQQIVTLRLTFE